MVKLEELGCLDNINLASFKNVIKKFDMSFIRTSDGHFKMELFVKSIIVPYRLLNGPHIFMVDGQILTPSFRKNGRLFKNDYTTDVDTKNNVGFIQLEGCRRVYSLYGIQRTDNGDRWSWSGSEGVIFDDNMKVE